MRYIKNFLIFLLIVSPIYSKVNAEPVVKGDFAVFSSFTGVSLYDEILTMSEKAVIDSCSAAGRMIPFEYNYKKAAFEKSTGTDRAVFYKNAAAFLKADIYAVLSSYNENGEYVLKIELIPLSEKYKDLKCEKIIKSRIPENISLKVSREFLNLLKNINLKSDVIKIFDDGSALINAGQWHGLETGSYTTDSGKVAVKNVTRYTAIAQGISFKEGQSLEFNLLPKIDNYIRRIDYEIGENIVKVYGTDEFLDKRDGRVRESIQGTCVINQGANFCFPGYGSFLSVEYMGIEKGKPDYAGVLIASSLTAVHLGLVPVMTDFKVKFLPWAEDSGRTDQMKRLNYFMWGTIPLTFTASFYNQLAYNYRENNLLPPQFADRDISAAVVSVFVPGGGMFYKGYRWTGWGIYISELSLAGYAVYTEDKKERNVLLGSLAAVKCAEIIVSYFIPQGYPLFKREISSSDDVNFSIGLNNDYNGDGEITASLSFSF